MSTDARSFTTIGDECTLNVNSFVHYGTTIGDAVVLAPDTFLMKGEDVAAGERLGRQPRAVDGLTSVDACPVVTRP